MRFNFLALAKCPSSLPGFASPFEISPLHVFTLYSCWTMNLSPCHSLFAKRVVSLCTRRRLRTPNTPCSSQPSTSKEAPWTEHYTPNQRKLSITFSPSVLRHTPGIAGAEYAQDSLSERLKIEPQLRHLSLIDVPQVPGWLKRLALTSPDLESLVFNYE